MLSKTLEPHPYVSFGLKQSRIAAVISMAITAGAFSTPALSASYNVSNETELRQAIIDANNSADASSTITLTSNIPLASNTAFTGLTKPITINTNGFALSGLDQPSGTANAGTLTFSGNTLTVLGTLRGGNGFQSTGNDGAGGAGLTLNSGSLINNGNITGGTGGDNMSGVGSGGAAGAGAVLAGGSHVNNGTINGGVGGTNSSGAIRGGSGVLLSNGSLVNNGLIKAGDGNFYASNSGVSLSGTTFLTNTGTIEGSSNITSNAGGVNLGINVTGSATITNTGTIRAGTGGPSGGQAIWVSVFGGADNLTLINSGTIAAGTGTANAVEYDRNVNAINILELRAGSNIIGNVVTRGGFPNDAPDANVNDIFRLGGDADSSFDVSTIGLSAQYRGFNTFQKTGNSTWTLTGTTTALTPWVISSGALSVSSDANLGSAGGITFDGGALRTTSAFTSARNFTLNAGGGTFDTAADLTLSGVISGTGALTKTGSSALILNNTNPYSGATNVLAGTLAIGNASNPGAALTGSTINVASGGIFGGYGSVTGPVNNAGTIAVADAISAFAGSGSGTFTINGDLTNAGTLQIGGQGVGNQLIVSGNYVGQNGLIRLNSFLGSDGSPSDRLVLDGGVASGTSRLAIMNAGGPGTAITQNGIEVISAINGASSGASTFSLAGHVKAGAYEYYLAKGGFTGGTAENWYLRNFLTTTTGTPTTPLYRREAPIYSDIASVARQLSLEQLGTFRDRHGDRSIIDETEPLSPFWIRAWGSDTRLSQQGTTSPEFDGSMFGLQIGHDLYQNESASGHRNHFGIMGGMARAVGDVQGFAAGMPNLNVGNLAINQYSVGGYWTHLGPTGWYTNAVLMGSALSIDAKSNDGGGASPHGKAVTGSIEAGVPFALSDRVVFEPQAQLVWQRFWIDDLTDSASKVTFDQNDSYRARIGARLRSNITLGNTLWQPYLKANVLRDFGDHNETTFSNITTLNTKVGQTSGQIAAGIVGRINPISSIYAGLSYQANLDSNEQRILMGNVGVQLNW